MKIQPAHIAAFLFLLVSALVAAPSMKAIRDTNPVTVAIAAVNR